MADDTGDWAIGDLVEYDAYGCRFTARLTRPDGGRCWKAVVETFEGEHESEGVFPVGSTVSVIYGHSVKIDTLAFSPAPVVDTDLRDRLVSDHTLAGIAEDAGCSPEWLASQLAVVVAPVLAERDAEIERLHLDIQGYQVGGGYERGHEHGSAVAAKLRAERDELRATVQDVSELLGTELDEGGETRNAINLAFVLLRTQRDDFKCALIKLYEQRDRLTAERDELRAHGVARDIGEANDRLRAELAASVRKLEKVRGQLVAILRDHPGGGLIREPADWMETLGVVRAHLDSRKRDRDFRIALVQTVSRWTPAGEPIEDWRMLSLIGRLSERASESDKLPDTEATEQAEPSSDVVVLPDNWEDIVETHSTYANGRCGCGALCPDRDALARHREAVLSPARPTEPRAVYHDPGNVEHEYDEDEKPINPSVGWDIAWGCRVSFSHYDGAWRVTVAVSDAERRNGGAIRSVTREHLRQFAHQLIELTEVVEDGAPIDPRPHWRDVDRSRWDPSGIPDSISTSSDPIASGTAGDSRDAP
jgi:hypothetical protein